MATRILSKISRTGSVVGRLIDASSRPESISDGLHYLKGSSLRSFSSNSRLVPHKLNQFLRSRDPFNINNYRLLGFFSSASPQSNEKEASHSTDQEASGVTNSDSASQEQEDSTVEELELSRDELIKLVAEKEEDLKLKHEEINKMKDKVLRSYAEMENVIGRTKREAENSKKFAIQSFAKSLLDVADNLGRASSVVKESFSKVDVSKDSTGAVPLLNTLLEGVEMTNKQLAEVLKKHGVEKIDPLNEQFDPNRHSAVFQVPDPSKPPGIVATVLKPGYVLFDRVIRPAEVGVTVALNNETDESSTA